MTPPTRIRKLSGYDMEKKPRKQIEIDSPQYFASIEEIKLHAASYGFEIKIKSVDKFDIEGHSCEVMEIDFYLPDGRTPFSRTYDLLDDGRYECMEEAM